MTSATSRQLLLEPSRQLTRARSALTAADILIFATACSSTNIAGKLHVLIDCGFAPGSMYALCSLAVVLHSNVLWCWQAPHQATSKPDAAKPKPDAAKEKPVKQEAAADAPRRVTRSQTRAMAQGASLNSLLEARSAAATSSRRSAPPSLASQQEQQQQPQQQQRSQQQQRAPAVPPLPDIDAPDRHNHLAECQYVNDIYSYFRHIEPKYRAPANYMDSQVRTQLTGDLCQCVQQQG